MNERKWYLQGDMILGVSAFMVSLIALGVGMYTAYIERASAHASVWPHLLIARSVAVSPERNINGLSFVVSNKGTGPAIIKSAEFKIDGKAHPDWVSIRTTLVGEQRANYTQSHISTSVLAAEDTLEVFKTQDEGLAEAFYTAQNQGRFEAQVCYCSVFDKCWQTDGARTLEVSRCNVPEIPFTQ